MDYKKYLGDRCQHYANVEKGFYCWKCIEELKDRVSEELWKHPARFEGIKCKTCIPIDYVDEVLEVESEKKEWYKV